MENKKKKVMIRSCTFCIMVLQDLYLFYNPEFYESYYIIVQNLLLVVSLTLENFIVEATYHTLKKISGF